MSFTKVYRWVTKFKSLNRMLLILVILQLTTMTNKKRNTQKILDLLQKDAKYHETLRPVHKINKSLSQFS